MIKFKLMFLREIWLILGEKWNDFWSVVNVLIHSAKPTHYVRWSLEKVDHVNSSYAWNSSKAFYIYEEMPSLVYTGYFMIWSLVTCLKVFYLPPHDLPSSLLKWLLFFLTYIVLSLLKAFDIAIYAN